MVPGGVTQKKLLIFFLQVRLKSIFRKVKKLQGLSICFKRFTAKFVVGGADSSPPLDGIGLSL